tara:strand:- start:16644 stop:17945 length:1302 start_codon:yes stop_codon:yes gene_type:complete
MGVNKQFWDFSIFSTAAMALEATQQAATQNMAMNADGNSMTGRVRCLTAAIPLDSKFAADVVAMGSTQDIDAYGPNAEDTEEDEAVQRLQERLEIPRKYGRMKFLGYLIPDGTTNHTEHAILSDPCKLSALGDKWDTAAQTSLAVICYINEDYNGPIPMIGDVLEVKLPPGDVRRGIQHATVTNYEMSAQINAQSSAEDAVCLAGLGQRMSSIFDGALLNGGDYSAAANEPAVCDWKGGAKAYSVVWNSTEYSQWNRTTLNNGQLSDTGMLVKDTTTGAELIPPAMEDFRRLASAYKAKFGKILKGSGYRTYQGQVNARILRITTGNPCGSGPYNAAGKNIGVAATPGRSNHGWGAAVDLDRSTWTNGAAGNSPEFRWINKFSRQFNFVFGVGGEHWHLDWMPFSRQVQTLSNPTAQTAWTPDGQNDDSITLT